MAILFLQAGVILSCLQPGIGLSKLEELIAFITLRPLYCIGLRLQMKFYVNLDLSN